MTTVQTVTGRIDSAEMGVTMTHEHVICDASAWWHKPTPGERDREALAEREISMEMLGLLRTDPFLVRHNLSLDSEEVAADELVRLYESGGRTVLDPTCVGLGQNAEALNRVSLSSGVTIIAGSGYYQSHSRPAAVAKMSIDEIAHRILSDLTEGIDNTAIRSGFIGEIGITDGSTEIRPEDERVLRGAARAQAESRVPLAVHLVDRLAHEVLDIVEDEGANVGATILCHRSYTHDDPIYQISLARRGAWLGYDQIGIDFYFPEQNLQCPSDDQNARAVCGLVEAGFADRLLLSGDVFLKMQLVRYGGFGYAHVLDKFLPRLKRLGVDDATLDMLMVANPRRLFESAARG